MTSNNGNDNDKAVESLLQLCCRKVVWNITKEDVPYIPSDLYEPIQRHMTRRRMITVFDVYRTWWKNGQLWMQNLYKNGRAHGLWREWNRYGQLISEKRYINARLHGTSKRWHGNGKIWSTTEWVQGKKHGIEEVYLSNGKLSNQTEFKKGEPHGTHKQWNRRGRLIAEKEYKNGYLYRWRRFDHVGPTPWTIVHCNQVFFL